MSDVQVEDKSEVGTPPAGMLPISLEALCPTSALRFDLFLRSDPGASVVLYRECSVPLEASDIERLRSSGIPTLYIRLADHSRYSRYVREEVIPNENVPAAQRYNLLRNVSRTAFETAFRSGNAERAVMVADEFAGQMTDLICDQDVLVSELFSLVEHDYYTFTHATNVSTYCLTLALALGISDREELVSIGAGALLHDLGKRQIAPFVLNKLGPLNDEDWRQIRQHPSFGFEALCDREDIGWGQLMMVYQHHERIDGRGYPVRLGGEEIHTWARICSVADVFDALTSERPYRKPIPIDKVLSMLQEDSGKAFDKDMVECWIAQVRRQPPSN